jgi:hypothetical protein
MPVNHKEEQVQRARADLLDSVYGRFDLIPDLIPTTLLMREKPRQLRKLIALRLALEVEQIGYRTFISWLYRFRIRQHGLQEKEEDIHTLPPPEPKEKGDGGTESLESADWRAFRASDPIRNQDTDHGLLAFPEYE